jgi:regulator of sigma E protease
MFDFLLGNDFLSAVVAFVLVLIPAVLVHELGHFFAAKTVGITILEFGIGFPPRLVKLFTLGGTDYTLNALPLGGFVRPLGEDMVRQVGEEATSADRMAAEARGMSRTMSVNEAPPMARIWFFVAGALVNFLFAVVLFSVDGLNGVVQPGGTALRIVQIEDDSALAAVGLQPGDVIVGVNDKTDFDSPATLFSALADGGASPVLNVVRVNSTAGTQEEITVSVTSVNSTVTRRHPIIVQVASGSPAQQGGLLAGDLVIRFNDTAIENVEALQAATQANLDNEVVLVVLRGGEEVVLRVTPRSEPPPGQGAMGVTISGVALSPEYGIVYEESVQRVRAPLPLGEAIAYGFNRTGSFFAAIASLPGELIRGTMPAAALTPVGPVGISMLGADLLRDSISGVQTRGINLIEFMALISLSLGLTNLLPIPALDGGRVMFVLIEIVRGKPIAPEREGMVHLVGLALLLSLMVVVMINDFVNPITNLIP